MKRVPAILPRSMRRLHLHPQQLLPCVHYQVIPRTLPPGLRHPQPQRRRHRHKCRLSHLPPLFPRQLPPRGLERRVPCDVSVWISALEAKISLCNSPLIPKANRRNLFRPFLVPKPRNLLVPAYTCTPYPRNRSTRPHFDFHTSPMNLPDPNRRPSLENFQRHSKIPPTPAREPGTFPPPSSCQRSESINVCQPPFPALAQVGRACPSTETQPGAPFLAHILRQTWALELSPHQARSPVFKMSRSRATPHSAPNTKPPSDLSPWRPNHKSRYIKLSYELGGSRCPQS